jgi:hypothetical protein
LARIIQVGAASYQVKADAEKKVGNERELSRVEWANLAGMSTRELHRRVSDYRNAKNTMTNVLQSDKNFQHNADLTKRTQLQANIIATMARNLDAREARLMRLRP